MHVLLVGHSIIARLSMDSTLLYTCRLPPNTTIQYRGVSGARIPRFLNERLYPIPDIVFVQIGENEVGFVNPIEIVTSLIRLCQNYLEQGVHYVVIGAFLPRTTPRGISVSMYNRRIRWINFELFRIARGIQGLFFMRMRNFRLHFLHRDGVHLSVPGQRWFFQSSSRVLLRFYPPQRVLSVAGASTKTPAQSKPDATSNTLTDPDDNLPQHERWMQINKVFYGPERDMVNYPPPKQRETAGKVRLGFIPDELFQWLYPKTGVTGPYLFIWGGVAYLLSKEIVVLDHSFSHAIGFILAVWYLKWKLTPWADKYIADSQKRHNERIFLNPVKKGKKVYEVTIEQLEKDIWRQDGQKYLYEAKRENVALQLEAEYRRRMETVYEQVRQRLNYQLDMETAKRRHEQEHMVNWIVSNVVKNITPQQEKESIASCIKNLKQLASAQPAV